MLKRKDVPPIPMMSQTAPIYTGGMNKGEMGMGDSMEEGGKLPPLPSGPQGAAAPLR